MPAQRHVGVGGSNLKNPPPHSHINLTRGQSCLVPLPQESHMFMVSEIIASLYMLLTSISVGKRENLKGGQTCLSMFKQPTAFVLLQFQPISLGFYARENMEKPCPQRQWISLRELSQ